MKNESHHKPATLEERLRAGRPRLAPGPDFTEKVIAALEPRRKATVARPEPALRLLPRLAFGAALMVMATLALWRMPRQQPDPAPAIANPPAMTEAPAPVRIPSVSAEQVEALTAKIDEPLEKELKSMVSDTRQAIQFVAANFLP